MDARDDSNKHETSSNRKAAKSRCLGDTWWPIIVGFRKLEELDILRAWSCDLCSGIFRNEKGDAIGTLLGVIKK
jgi:hypothetical protein